MDFQEMNNMFSDYLIKGVATILIIGLILSFIWMLATGGYDDLLSLWRVKYNKNVSESTKNSKYRKLYRVTHLIVTIAIVVSIVLDTTYLLLSYGIITADGQITIIFYNYGTYINLGFSIFTLCAIVINFVVYKKCRKKFSESSKLEDR